MNMNQASILSMSPSQKQFSQHNGCYQANEASCQGWSQYGQYELWFEIDLFTH